MRSPVCQSPARKLTETRFDWALAARVIALAVLAALGPGNAWAYLGATPSLDVGVVLESNPRYRDLGGRSVSGTFTDARVEFTAESLTNLIKLTPRFRQTNHLGNNRDLNDDDFYLDLQASHEGRRGQAGLLLSYRDIGLRTGEFESATPDDPDANPIPGGGSGRLDLTDNTQQTILARPYLSYSLSPRNSIQVSADVTSTEYDRDVATSYFDYTYSSASLSLTHSLNPKNSFLLSLNRGNFSADQPAAIFENNSDTYGLSVAYRRAVTLTWAADINIGTSRTTVSVLNPFSFDPESGLQCFPIVCRQTDQNFVGNLSLRKRSERTVINLSAGRSLAPRSDGTEVVQDQFRFLLDRRLSPRLTGSVALAYLDETAVADIFRQEREYFTVDGRLRWQLTQSWSVFSSYSYIENQSQTSQGFDNTETNNRWYLGFTWRGTEFRW